MPRSAVSGCPRSTIKKIKIISVIYPFEAFSLLATHNLTKKRTIFALPFIPDDIFSSSEMASILITEGKDVVLLPLFLFSSPIFFFCYACNRLHFSGENVFCEIVTFIQRYSLYM